MSFELGLLWLMSLVVGAVEFVASDGNPSLKVVSYNVNYAGDVRPTLTTIADADGDLVLLQETTPAWETALRRRFGATYPHMIFRHWRRGAGGLAVLSRVPLVAEDVLAPTDGWFPAQRLVVRTASGTEIQLLHVHLRPAIDQGDWVRGFFSTPPIRRREIEGFCRSLAPGMATVVAGDFNEEPGGTALGFLVERGLTRVETGEMPTWEWQGDWKGAPVHLRMKLDHIFIDGRLVARAGHVAHGGGSDHRPVVATVEIAAR